MNKKILYGIFFVSIFLLSTAASIQPVRGYTWGVPKEAIGVTSESEIAVYDEDEFEKHLGEGISIKDFKNGDPDEVGAKSKSHYIEMETDEDLISYEEDYLYAAVDFEANAEVIRVTLWDLGGFTDLVPDIPPMLQFIMGMTSQVQNPIIGDDDDNALTAAYLADLGANNSLESWDALMDLYSNEYDGSILTRELWDWTDKEYKEKPDEKKDEVPFLADPRDWYSAYQNLQGLGWHIEGICDAIQTQLNAWMAITNPYTGNLTLHAIINATMEGYTTAYEPVLKGYLNMINDDYVIASYVLSSYIIQNIYYSTAAAIPDKFGYLLMLLEAGQPTYVPQDDFLARMLKEFDAENDFDGDHLYKIPYISYGKDTLGLLGLPGADGDTSSIPLGTTFMGLGMFPVPLGGETIYIYAEPEVTLEGGVITVEINYLDDQLDPAQVLDGESDPDELDDWEWVFAYGDTGSSSETIQAGDTILWQPKGIEAIPGFEVSIILGASAVSIIGLIYVIMKKRKM